MSVDDTERTGERPTRELSVTVNGEEVTAEVEPRLKLSDFLRAEAGCRGVRVGCEHGVCGACTVSLDGDLVKSCLLYAVQADGDEVATVEGLDDDGVLGPVQEAFHETHALQCGFCTSGFVMSTHDLLADSPDPSRTEIEEHLSSNICRCTGYQNIYDAVEHAADKMASEGESEDEDDSGSDDESGVEVEVETDGRGETATGGDDGDGPGGDRGRGHERDSETESNSGSPTERTNGHDREDEPGSTTGREDGH